MVTRVSLKYLVNGCRYNEWNQVKSFKKDVCDNVDGAQEFIFDIIE